MVHYEPFTRLALEEGFGDVAGKDVKSIVVFETEPSRENSLDHAECAHGDSRYVAENRLSVPGAVGIPDVTCPAPFLLSIRG